MYSVAKIRIKAGYLSDIPFFITQSLSIAKKIDDGVNNINNESKIMSNVVHIQVESGDIIDSLHTANKIPSIYYRSAAISSIAIAVYNNPQSLPWEEMSVFME
jgi:hypothetical protein